MSFLDKIFTGKNSKWKYYLSCYWREYIPRFFYQKRLQKELKKIYTRPDSQYILKRINYYNSLSQYAELSPDAIMLGEYNRPNHLKVYYFDTYEYTRWFPDSYKFQICSGDITHIPDTPSIVKSRPISNDNANSVVLNLDKVRHFLFVKDKIPFEEKESKVIFRGIVGNRDLRRNFMRKFFGNPLFDVGDTGNKDENPKEWFKIVKPISWHFNYRYIMALEGNDVASNLKWVMSSNCIAVMPKPTYETWFMEGTLIPNYHYIEVKKDFSDLEEKIKYYDEHLDEAQEIINHAHEYVLQFFDKKRERLIALGVLDKYFQRTQLVEVADDEYSI